MKKQRLGLEPLDVDLSIQSHRGTAAEEAEFAAYLAQRKERYAAQQRRAVARRSRAANPPANAA